MVVEASAVPQMGQGLEQKRTGTDNFDPLPAASRRQVGIHLHVVSFVFFDSLVATCVCVRKEGLHLQS